MVGPEVRGDMLGNGLWLCTLRCQVENDRSRFVPVTPTWDLGVLTVAAATPSPVTVVNHHDYFIFNKGPLLHFAIHCYTCSSHLAQPSSWSECSAEGQG